MGLNWVDWVIICLVVIAAVLGFVRGLVRQIIGLCALLVGFILAARYYISLSYSLRPALANETWARLVAFLLIFIASLLVGGFLGWVVSKLMKGPLKVADILFGGLFGLIQGALIASVFVLGLIVFPVKEKSLLESRFAPCCLGLGQALVHLVPHELKVQFKEAYQNLKGERTSHGKKI